VADMLRCYRSPKYRQWDEYIPAYYRSGYYSDRIWKVLLRLSKYRQIYYLDIYPLAERLVDKTPSLNKSKTIEGVYRYLQPKDFLFGGKIVYVSSIDWDSLIRDARREKNQFVLISDYENRRWYVEYRKVKKHEEQVRENRKTIRQIKEVLNHGIKTANDRPVA